MPDVVDGGLQGGGHVRVAGPETSTRAVCSSVGAPPKAAPHTSCRDEQDGGSLPEQPQSEHRGRDQSQRHSRAARR